jgi:diguanylate cyclase (GGDEF)-like protein
MAGLNAAVHRWALRDWGLLLLMCTLVCAGDWMSARLSVAAGNLSCVWLTNGIIAAFFVTRPRRFRGAFLIAGQLTALAVDLTTGFRLSWACWFAVCNSTEILITVLPLRHFKGRANATTKSALTKIALFGIVLGPLAGGLLAEPLVKVIVNCGFLEAVRIWFFADALGAAATLPPMILLLTREQSNRPMKARIGDTTWASLLAALAIVVFWQTKYPLIFLLFPPLVIALFRFRLQGAIYGTSVVVLIAAIFTAQAHGPFALSSNPVAIERVLLFQIFGLVVFASFIPLGFAAEERYRLEKELQRANQRLGERLLVDTLTGVQNRLGFDNTLASEWLRARAAGSELSLVYIDIDFFKRFNDVYGHQSGDGCLRSVAQAIAGSVRPGDCVARYGGEEFIIILADTSRDAAKAITDRVAAAILNLRIPHKESPFGVVTASFGVATARPGNDDDPYQLIRMADEALYAAKRGGRDRIESRSGTRVLLGA